MYMCKRNYTSKINTKILHLSLGLWSKNQSKKDFSATTTTRLTVVKVGMKNKKF